jgi:hypothetical protein
MRVDNSYPFDVTLKLGRKKLYFGDITLSLSYVVYCILALGKSSGRQEEEDDIRWRHCSRPPEKNLLLQLF